MLFFSSLWGRLDRLLISQKCWTVVNCLMKISEKVGKSRKKSEGPFSQLSTKEKLGRKR